MFCLPKHPDLVSKILCLDADLGVYVGACGVFDKVDVDQSIVLMGSELEAYFSFKEETARNSFLAGRLCAKVAYNVHIFGLPVENFKNIQISNGIFGHPLLKNSPCAVSISHTKEAAIAFAFDHNILLGVDIERVDPKNTETLSTIIKEDPPSLNKFSLDVALTVCWCFKEALSKAIKTGITIPIEILEIESIYPTNNPLVLEGRFKNFPQYRGLAQIRNNLVIAIVFPQQLNPCADHFII